MSRPRTNTTTPTAIARTKRVEYSEDTPRRRISGRYDAAKRTTENANLWAGVDSLSAAQANNPAVRQIIRDRARHETGNSPYLCGIVSTVANDIIGPVIRLQVGSSKEAQKVEADFAKWAKAIKLFKKLRTMCRAKTVDGEGFATMVSNPKVNNPVKLDIRLFECEMCASYFTANTLKDNEIDGIRFDGNGNATHYRILKYHPGDYRAFSKSGATAGTWHPAKNIIHWFNEDRAGQVRGVSEVVSSITLFGQLRRYTSAVVESSARAAEISGVISTNLLPDEMAAASIPARTVMNLERNAVVSMPDGWEFEQLKAEQPIDAYPDFKKEIVNEAARPLNMPLNVASGNSSGYNYASGRLDQQTYKGGIDVTRSDLETEALDRIYAEWLPEYAIKNDLNKAIIDEVKNPVWRYKGRGHADPAKEANADNVRINNGTLTRTRYYAEQGLDGKIEEENRITELIDGEVAWNAAREKAGLEPAPYPSGLSSFKISTEATTEEPDNAKN